LDVVLDGGDFRWSDGWIRWSIGQLVRHSDGWMISWSDGQMVRWLVEGFIGQFRYESEWSDFRYSGSVVFRNFNLVQKKVSRAGRASVSGKSLKDQESYKTLRNKIKINIH